MTPTTVADPTTSPARAPESGVRRAAVHSEWIKFRTVRGWLIGLVLAAGLLLTFTFVVANGHHQDTCTGTGDCHPGHPSVPTGPDQQAVADSYQYYAQTLTGDGTLTARVTALSGLISTGANNQAAELDHTRAGLADWAKAGILLTPSTRPGSTYAAVAATGGHGLRFQWDYTHDQAGRAATVTDTTPTWLRLSRTGDTVTGYESTDGATWHPVGTTRLPGLPATVSVGLFVTSPVTAAQVATQATARFDNLGLTGTATGAWQAHSIGMGPQDFYPTLGDGSAQPAGDTVTLTGSGDIALAVASIAGGDTAAGTLLFGLVVALIVMIVIATGFVTGEYRRGLIRTTLAATPQRGAVLAGKAVVAAVVAFLLGALAAAVALPLGRHVLVAHGNYVFPTNTATLVRVVVGTGLLLALSAVGVLALGAILRRAAATVSIGILVFVLPMLLGPGVLGGPAASGGLVTWLYRASPAAGLSVFGTVPRSALVDYPFTLANGYYPLGPWAGLAVLAGYAAAALALATYLLRRRDA